MLYGKAKCRILKEIRQKIADENEIPYVTRECRYQGDCSGTCPRCESELRYLEQQLSLRASMGKRVTVAALCAGVALSGTGCNPVSAVLGGETELSGAIPYEDTAPSPTPYIEVTEGEVPWPDETSARGGSDVLPSDEDGSPTANDAILSEEKDPYPEVFELTGAIPLPEYASAYGTDG